LICISRRFGALPQSSQQSVVELQLRNVRHLARDLAETLDAAAALGCRLILGVRHGDPRHIKKKPRIDPIVAGLDAIAVQQAAIRPIARRFIAFAAPHDVDHAADDRDRFGGHAGRRNRRTDLDALAAARAGIGHGVGAGL
jgi:hypothetical protein